MAAAHRIGQKVEEFPDTVEGLFTALETPLLMYAMKLVQTNDIAQDLVQEAFLRLHDRLAEVAHPKAWLYRTVHNLAMNHHRSRRREVPLEETIGESGDRMEEKSVPAPDAALERLEAIGMARLFIRKLKERDRVVLLLKFEEDLSYKQIGEKTGLSIGNVGYVLHQTLKKLAHEMERVGVKP